MHRGSTDQIVLMKSLCAATNLFASVSSLAGWSGAASQFCGRGSMRYYSFLSVEPDDIVWGASVCVIDVLLTCFNECCHAPVEPVPVTHLLLMLTKR